MRAKRVFAFVFARVDFATFDATKNGNDASAIPQNAFPPLIQNNQNRKRYHHNKNDDRKKKFNVDLVHLDCGNAGARERELKHRRFNRKK